MIAVTFLTLLLPLLQAADPELNMTAIELIRYWGYPAEAHDVATEDGYILALFRIPHGRFSNDNSSCHRPPILLVHGVGIGASEFIINLPESTPAFILADAGFDVFLLNHRGTTYSRRHETLRTSEKKFWEFSIDELAKYDAPAAIDKVLEVSGANGTYWIGHSQGTAVGYMALAERPEYNGKVKALFQLTPTGTGGYVKGLNKVALLIYKVLHPLVDFYRYALGAHEIAFSLHSLFDPFVRLCKAFFGSAEMCTMELRSWLLGPELVICITWPQLNTVNALGTNIFTFADQITRDYTNLLARTINRMVQMASSRRVQHFDYSPYENITPPPYNYSLVDVPVYHFWSNDDWISTREDIEMTLLRMLRKDVVKGSIEIPGYNHGDFALAPDCGEMVFKPIVKIVRKEEVGMCEQ